MTDAPAFPRRTSVDETTMATCDWNLSTTPNDHIKCFSETQNTTREATNETKNEKADTERSAATEKTKAYTNTYRLLEGQEAVADPTARRAVSTDVRKTFLVVSVWGTERHLLYRLVNNKALKQQQRNQQKATTASSVAGIMYKLPHSEICWCNILITAHGT